MANESILFKIAADLTQLRADMDRANGIVKSGFDRMKGAADGLRNVFTGLAGVLSVGAFSTWVKGGIDAADKMNEVSKRTGVAVEDLSNLKFAVEQSGGSFEGLSSGLAKFEVNLSKTGISGKETIPMLEALADRFNASKDPAEKLRIAVAAFGKSAGPELVEFLSLGSKGIAELVEKNRALGNEMSGRTAQAADDFNDMLGQLKNAAQAASVAVGSGLTQAFADFKTQGLSPEILSNLQTFGELLGKVSRAVLDHLPMIARLASAYAGMKMGGGIGALTGPAAPYAVPAGGAIGAVTGFFAPDLLGKTAVEKANANIEELQAKLAALREKEAKGTVPFLMFNPKITQEGMEETRRQILSIETQLEAATAARDKLIDVSKAPAAEGAKAAASDVSRFLAKMNGETEAKVKSLKETYDGLFAAAEKQYRLPSGLLKSIAAVETGGTFKAGLTSPKGAQGIMQFMPPTAREYGVANAFLPAQAIPGAGRYMADLMVQFQGDLLKSIAAYNMGPSALKEKLGKGGELIIGKLPKETQKYVKDVAKNMMDFGEVKLDVDDLIAAQEEIEKLNKEAQQTKLALLEATGDKVGAGILAINQKYDELIAKLQAVGDTAGIAAAQQARAAEVAKTIVSGKLEQWQVGADVTESKIRLKASEQALKPAIGEFDQQKALASLTDAERDHLKLLEEKKKMLTDLSATQNLDYETWAKMQVQINDTQTAINEGMKGRFDEMTEFTRQAARNMQDAMSSFFFDLLQGKMDNLASSFKSMIDKMVANWLASQLNNLLFGENFNQGTGVLGGLFGSLFGTSASIASATTAASSAAASLETTTGLFMGLFAHGGAIDQGQVLPYAGGGVVNSPVYFPMARGQIGLMGEAGPEAILPLKKIGAQFGVLAQTEAGTTALPLTRIGRDLGVSLKMPAIPPTIATIKRYVHGGAFAFASNDALFPRAQENPKFIHHFAEGGVFRALEWPQISPYPIAPIQPPRPALQSPAVSPPAATAGGQNLIVNFNLPGVRNPEEFKRSVGQQAASAAQLLSRSARRNG